jgi:hypothetical protein
MAERLLKPRKKKIHNKNSFIVILPREQPKRGFYDPNYRYIAFKSRLNNAG